MLKFLADENFHNHVVRGARRRLPSLDLLRVHEVGLSGASDPAVLAWAAERERILLTHDVRTIWPSAESRMQRREPMPGILFVPQPFLLADVIRDILLVSESLTPEEVAGSWLYLPLR